MSYYLQSSDGLVDIHCRHCGDVICRSSDAGFRVATCYRCAETNPADESIPLEILEAEGRLPQQEEHQSFVQDVIDTVVEKVEEVVTKVKNRKVKKTSSPKKGLGLKKEM